MNVLAAPRSSDSSCIHCVQEESMGIGVMWMDSLPHARLHLNASSVCKRACEGFIHVQYLLRTEMCRNDLDQSDKNLRLSVAFAIQVEILISSFSAGG